MTDHHDELRIAPDPSRAEELRQRLHARLGSGSRGESIVPIQDDLVSMSSVDADPDDRVGDIALLETEDRTGHGVAPRRRSSRRWVLAAAAVVVTVVSTLLVVGDDDDEIGTVTTPPTSAETLFVGAWRSTGTEGSPTTMYIDHWDAYTYQVRMSDQAGRVCTGVGRLATETSLVVARVDRPESSCDRTASLPSPETELVLSLDLSTEHDQLVDSFGVVWRRQAAPPPDAEHAARLEAFLEARVAGEGAEQYLGSGFSRDDRVPLLYATTSGAAYERFEIERVQDPDGAPNYDVRLFAENGTVVQQRFFFGDDDGGLVLAYGGSTLEDGHAALVPYSVLDGGVTFGVLPMWEVEVSGHAWVAFRHRLGTSAMVIAAEPLSVWPSCENAPTPADAEALARSIIADSGYEVSEATPVRIAGIDGLQIDVAVPDHGQYLCSFGDSETLRGVQSGGTRMRLFLVDHPGESAGVLTFAVLTNADELEGAIAEATPTIDSVELHPR